MPEGGFFEQKSASPFSLAFIVGIHAAAIAALMLAKGPIMDWRKIPPTKVVFIPETIPPEPEILPDPEPRPVPPQHRSVIESVPPVISIPSPGPVVDYTTLPDLGITITPPGEVTIPGPPRSDPVAPVRVDAQIDPRFARDLQPPYPAAEERAEREGSVNIRVTIGADGRVKAVEKLSAASDAFWRVTERQALTRWRFRPATVDGRPVESRKTMTVHFRLDNR